jgi:cell division protein FtsB
MDFSEFWTSIKIRKWAKYVITILVFAVVFLFIGDQSVMHFIRRGKEIRHLEEQRDMYREGAAKAEQEIRTLNQPDSLERYAREQYFMHAPNEDIYLVEEPK